MRDERGRVGGGFFMVLFVFASSVDFNERNDSYVGDRTICEILSSGSQVWAYVSLWEVQTPGVLPEHPKRVRVGVKCQFDAH